MEKVFQLESSTIIDGKNSYIQAYPHILNALASSPMLTEQDFICGAHMVYGWMPTILEIYASQRSEISHGVALLNKARTQGVLTYCELSDLAQLINRSFVGASKLLHFVNPQAFAIWDSRIYRFIYGNTPHQYRVNNAAIYEKYLQILFRLKQDKRFPAFHTSVNRKMGYPVSALRALEVVMFLNGTKDTKPLEPEPLAVAAG